ncbi:hypothetical protein HXX76_013518 [Chlamydomonas incerta]|uniref:tRNA (guanine(9)-N(1))-methyltransferase n=1 Tax=Chlamydomonas incerta TaxID=51695 RepID=A0A835STN5_CHLIN|nr:hypothetical protein HXX76_013518 [Chlamydomonas incerta]|eukprot:KAG2425676.1 hypothetical protein HXX76_013518 [Chlamydomonas incerta]
MNEDGAVPEAPGQASGAALADGAGAAHPEQLAEPDSSQLDDSSSSGDEEPSTSGRDDAGISGADSGPGRKGKRDEAWRAKRDEEWEARRRFNNLKRREKFAAKKKAKAAAAREKEEALLAAMTPEQAEQWRAAKEAAQAERAAAEAVQAARVEAALANGGPGSGPDVALRVVVDCSFAPSAPPKEMRSLIKQLENANMINKSFPKPACLTVTNWLEPLASMAATSGANGWRVVKLEEGPAAAFGPDRVVVLSPDAEEALEGVDGEHVYVIGGIVDRTVRKGLTVKFAETERVACRRLPIRENAEQLGLGKGVTKNPVLNIDDVVRALLVFHDTGDWVRALDAAIPIRKRKPQTMGFTPPKSRSATPGPPAGPGAEAEADGPGAEDAGQEQGVQHAGQAAVVAADAGRGREGQQPQQQPQRQRGSFWFRTLRVAGGGGLRRLLMPPVPPQCAYTGLNLQMQCSDDLRNATTEMLGYPTTDLASLAPTVSTKQLGAFLNKRRTPPSAQCCEAASAFVNLYCLCAPAMRDEFEEFVHWEQLQEIAHYLGKRCVEVNRPLTLYMDNNCPEHPI